MTTLNPTTNNEIIQTDYEKKDKNTEENILELAKRVINLINENKPLSITDIIKFSNKYASSAKNNFDDIMKYENFKEKNWFLQFLMGFGIILGSIFSSIVYILAFVCLLCYYIIFSIINFLGIFTKFFGDYEFFHDFDSDKWNFKYFLFLDVLKENIINNKEENITVNITEIYEDIKSKLKNRLEKYNDLIKSLKEQKDKEDLEDKDYNMFQEYQSFHKSLKFSEINSNELRTIFTGTNNIVIKVIYLIIFGLKFLMQYIFAVVKFIVTSILLFFKFAFKSFISLLQQALLKWSRPFAGLMILVFLILGIVIISYDSYAPNEELYNPNFTDIGGGSSSSNSNYDYTNMFNNNTDFLTALNRLPLEFYSFVNNFTSIYYDLLKRIKFFMNFGNEIIDDARNFAREPDDYERTKNNTEHLYDNIYTFEADYINSLISTNSATITTSNYNYENILKEKLDTIVDKTKYVVHLIRPNEISEMAPEIISENLKKEINYIKLKIEPDYSLAIKCAIEHSSNIAFFNHNCTINGVDINIIKTSGKSESCSTYLEKDYDNII